jgi:hypothetical protein
MNKRPATLLAEMPDGVFGHAALLDIVENQLRDRNPPETALALARLSAEGFSREDAVHLIACVVSVEIFEVIHAKQTFDPERFAENLAALPELPYDPNTVTIETP